MPTVLKIQLDASDVKTKLAAVEGDLQKFRQKASGNFEKPETAKKESSVKTNAAQAENAVRRTGLQVAKTGEKIKNITVPVETFGTKAKNAFSRAWKELTDGEGKAGEVAGAFKGILSPVGLIAIGIGTLGKLAVEVWDKMTVSAEEHAKKLELVADASGKARETEESAQNVAKQYISRLGELARTESSSNVNKRETAGIVAILTSKYGDLGAQIDATAGKIKNLDEVERKISEKQKTAMIKKIGTEIDDINRLREGRFVADHGGLTSDLGARKEFNAMKQLPLETQLAVMTKKRSNAKTAGDIEGYQKQIEYLRQLIELRKKMDSYRNTGHASPEEADAARQERRKNLDAQENANAEKKRQFAQRKSDEAFGDAKTVSEKTANREKLISAELAKQNTLRSALADAQERRKNAADEDSRMKIESEVLRLSGEIQDSEEKIHGWQHQITQAKKQQAKTISDMTLSAKTEEEAARLILNGEYEKAELLKLEASLKQQNLRLTKEEKLALLDHGKALGETRLRDNLSGSARSLLYDSMTRAGMGREAENERALYDAGKTKGGTLTESETEMVRRLAALQYGLKNLRESSPGDLDIKTNSLTSRGGFAGGAVVPNSERINTAIKKEIERMKDTQKEIRDMIDRILNG